MWSVSVSITISLKKSATYVSEKRVMTFCTRRVVSSPPGHDLLDEAICHPKIRDTIPNCDLVMFKGDSERFCLILRVLCAIVNGNKCPLNLSREAGKERDKSRRVKSILYTVGLTTAVEGARKT